MDHRLGEDLKDTKYKQLLKRYFSLDSGGLHNSTEVRFKASLLQFFMLLTFSILSFSYDFWLEQTTGYTFIIFLTLVIVFFLCLIFFVFAFYITVRDNLPRLVKTKNTPGLFAYTLVFFEALVLQILLWILYLVLKISGAKLCTGFLCSGIITGIFIFVNIVAGICEFVLARTRKFFGIGFLESFGMTE